MPDNEDGPIFDEPIPLAAFFIEVMAHADKLEADDPSGHGHDHEAFRLRGLADVCYQSFCMIVNELRYEFGKAVHEDEDAPIPAFFLGAMDAEDAVDAWSEEQRRAAAAKRGRHPKGRSKA